MPMLGEVARQPSLRLAGLGLLQASSPGSTWVLSSGVRPIVGTAATDKTLSGERLDGS